MNFDSKFFRVMELPAASSGPDDHEGFVTDNYHRLVIEYRDGSPIVRDYMGTYFDWAEISVGDDLDRFPPVEDAPYPPHSDQFEGLIWFMAGEIDVYRYDPPCGGTEHEYSMVGSGRPATEDEINSLDPLESVVGPTHVQV